MPFVNANRGPMAGVGYSVRDHRFHRLTVARVVRETADAVSLVLDVPEELVEAYSYEAGQFCNLRVEVDGEAHIRCYSMSSAPGVDARLQVTVKRVPGGIVSNWIVDRLRPGDAIDVSPPAGIFQLTPAQGELVAFAAGSGITPVFSLLKSVLVTTRRSARLLYANRDSESVIFLAELEALEERYPERLTVLHSLDEEHGFVEPQAIRSFVGGSATTDGAEHYICGPEAFMDIVEGTLLTDGVDSSRLHIERFTPLVPSPPETPPEPVETAAERRVTVELNGRCETTQHRRGTTILQMARELGMSPPFSCESGSCATCMARLVGGSVSMYVNNALTEEEVEEGWVLTCQSIPTTEHVHVVYEA